MIELKVLKGLKELNINEVLSDKILHKMIQRHPDVKYPGSVIDVDNNVIKTKHPDLYKYGIYDITFDRLREAYSEYYDGVDYFIKNSDRLEDNVEDYIDANDKPKMDEPDVLVVHPKSIMKKTRWSREMWPMLDAYNKNYGNELRFLSDIGVELDEFEFEGVLTTRQQQLEKKIKDQWKIWTFIYGLDNDNTSFNIDDEGNVELLVDTKNNTVLSLYGNDGNFLNFEDIVNNMFHDLNKSVIAESFINAVNDFNPADKFNELWSPELTERSNLKPYEFIQRLIDDKEYYKDVALKMNDDYGLSMEIDGVSPQHKLVKKIENQWRKWTTNHGLDDYYSSFNIDFEGEGNVKLLVNPMIDPTLPLDEFDLRKHTTLSLYDKDNNVFSFGDIVDEHGNLNEYVIAESFVNAVNDFNPDDKFNELWNLELVERDLKPSEFIKRLTEDKNYYEERALDVNYEYGLSVDLDGPSKEI